MIEENDSNASPTHETANASRSAARAQSSSSRILHAARALACVALIAAAVPTPLIDFQLVRYLVFGVALWTAFEVGVDGRRLLYVLLVLVACVFSPIALFQLSHETWRLIDAGAVAVFLYTFVPRRLTPNAPAPNYRRDLYRPTDFVIFLVRAAICVFFCNAMLLNAYRDFKLNSGSHFVEARVTSFEYEGRDDDDGFPSYTVRYEFQTSTGTLVKGDGETYPSYLRQNGVPLQGSRSDISSSVDLARLTTDVVYEIADPSNNQLGTKGHPFMYGLLLVLGVCGIWLARPTKPDALK